MHSPQKMIPIIMITFPLLLRQLHPNNLHPNLHPDLQNAKLDLLLERTKKPNWLILPPMHSLQKMIPIKKKNLANRTHFDTKYKKKKKIKKIISYILCFK